MFSNSIQFKFVFIFAVLLLKFSGGASFFGTDSTACGQGSLGRIRKNVREEKEQNESTSAKPEKKKNASTTSQPAPPKTNQRLASIRNSVRANQPAKNHRPARSHRHRHRRDYHHRPWAGLSFITPAYCPPPQPHVHVYEAAPVVYVASPAPPVPAPPVPMPLVQAPSNPHLPGAEILIDETTSPSPVYQHQPVIDATQDWLNDWSVRTAVFGGTDFDAMTHGSFSLLVQPPGSLGLDANVTTLREEGYSFRDNLWIGDANVTFEGVTGDLRLRCGLGFNWLADAYGSNFGFNLTAGFDWAIGYRWMLTGEADLGTIGDTDLTHLQISLGRRFHHTELMMGYNYYSIGGTPVGGMIAGLRFRF